MRYWEIADSAAKVVKPKLLPTNSAHKAYGAKQLARPHGNTEREFMKKAAILAPKP